MPSIKGEKFVYSRNSKHPNMSDERPIIEFIDVDINNSDTLVIEKLNLVVHEGDFVYITGKVGSGKTSIIRSIIGENYISGDTARVGDFNLLTIKNKQIPYLRRYLGIVFQDFQLLMDRTIHDNLEFVLKATGWKKGPEMEERISEVLKQVGMETKSHKMPHQLSGGEQQRIAIARSLLNKPGIILADEPTGNLDNETALSIMDLIQRINKEDKTAIVMVTHNQHLIKQYPGRVFVCGNSQCREVVNSDTEIDLDLDF